MNKFYILSIIAVTVCANAFCVYAQFYQRADYGDISVTRKNQLGGYDYYDKSGNRVGYSQKTYDGAYIYYDQQGNKIGVLKKEKDKNAYTFYNADNIATGSLRKTPAGEYRYEDKLEGGLKSVTPPPAEDIGFIPPSSFQQNIFNPELEGIFKKKEKK